MNDVAARMNEAASFQRLSAPGASALSLWELRASAAAMATLFDMPTLPAPDRPRWIRLETETGAALDEGVLWIRSRAPLEVVAELHLHGGLGVAAALRARLQSLGWRESDPSKAIGDDERRLLQARAPLNARVAAEACEGLFELALERLPASGAAREQTLSQWRAWMPWARLLDQPPRIVLAGPPNAGKSTLFNAWLRDERVTVSPHPGTTRDAVTAGIRLGKEEAAWEAWLWDTAGLWSQAQGVDADAVAATEFALAEAWRTIWVLDASEPPDTLLRQKLQTATEHDIRLLHRCDLGERWSPEREIGGRWLRGSSLSDAPGLLAAIETALLQPLGEPPPPGMPLPLGRERLERLA